MVTLPALPDPFFCMFEGPSGFRIYRGLWGLGRWLGLRLRV